MREVLNSKMIVEEIDDLIKVGKSGNTFHDPKGRLLSRHQIETILANADFIKEENERQLKVPLKFIDLVDYDVDPSSQDIDPSPQNESQDPIVVEQEFSEDDYISVEPDAPVESLEDSGAFEGASSVEAVSGADHDLEVDSIGYDQIDIERSEGDPERYLDKWPTEEEVRALQESNRLAELERSRERAFTTLAVDGRLKDIDSQVYGRYEEALGNFVDAYADASFKSGDRPLLGGMEKKSRLLDGVRSLTGKMFNTERHRRSVSFEQFKQVYIEAREAVIERHEEMFPASSFEDSRFNRLKIEQNMGDQILGLIHKEQAETARASARSRKKGAFSRFFGGGKARSEVVGSDWEYNLGRLRSLVRGKIDFRYLTASYDKETGQQDPMDEYALALEAIDSISY